LIILDSSEVLPIAVIAFGQTLKRLVGTRDARVSMLMDFHWFFLSLTIKIQMYKYFYIDKKNIAKPQKFSFPSFLCCCAAIF
jgi:hypothetical protein